MPEIGMSDSMSGERKRGYARGTVRHLQRAKAVERPENSFYLVAEVRTPFRDSTRTSNATPVREDYVEIKV